MESWISTGLPLAGTQGMLCVPSTSQICTGIVECKSEAQTYAKPKECIWCDAGRAPTGMRRCQARARRGRRPRRPPRSRPRGRTSTSACSWTSTTPCTRCKSHCSYDDLHATVLRALVSLFSSLCNVTPICSPNLYPQEIWLGFSHTFSVCSCKCWQQACHHWGHSSAYL